MRLECPSTDEMQAQRRGRRRERRSGGYIWESDAIAVRLRRLPVRWGEVRSSEPQASGAVGGELWQIFGFRSAGADTIRFPAPGWRRGALLSARPTGQAVDLSNSWVLVSTVNPSSE